MTPQSKKFMDSIQSRDTHCVLSEVEMFQSDYSGFEVAYIFLHAFEQEWKNCGYCGWVAKPDEVDRTNTLINCPRNSFLLQLPDLQLRWQPVLL